MVRSAKHSYLARMTRSIALFALPLLAACTTVPQASANLTGSRWTFVSIDGQRPVRDSAELTIAADRIGANVGCNGLGGDLKIEAGKLITGPMISTQMYCEGVMEQERSVAELLSASPAYFIEGNRLVIRSDKHVAELRRASLN